jgi:hypothetical protein
MTDKEFIETYKGTEDCIEWSRKMGLKLLLTIMLE